MGNGKLTG